MKTIHLIFAAAFIVFIGLTSFIFGARERDRRHESPYPKGRPWWRRLIFTWRWHFVFAGLIWGSGAYIVLATQEWVVPDSRSAAFWGEFVAFVAFGLSWLTKGAKREILLGDAPPDPSVAA